MRDAAIPQFLDAMQSRDGYTRRLAVTALADPYLNAYRNKETLVKEIAHVLADPDPLLRLAAGRDALRAVAAVRADSDVDDEGGR
jgi:hypothetical protein